MSTVDAIRLAPSFKSRLHADVRQQTRLIKDQSARELNEKLQKQDRAKSYARNVKEMYMPRTASNRVLHQNADLAPLDY